MSEHNFEVESGKSIKLLTKNKVCTEDIVVSAYGGSGIPDGYIKPEGSMDINENGTFDVREKAEVNVDVPPTPWERPKDWLPYPEMSEEYDEIWQLVYVTKDYGCCAIFSSGSFLVDWGDGIVEEIKNGGRHYYNFDDLDEGSENELGHRQCWCRLYKPRGTLSSFFIGNNYVNTGWKSIMNTVVEFIVNTSSESVKHDTYSTQDITRLEHIKIISRVPIVLEQIPNITKNVYVEGDFKFGGKIVFTNYRIPYNEIKYSFPENGVTNANMFFRNVFCRRVEVDCENVISTQRIFGESYIREVILKNTENSKDFGWAFYLCRATSINGLDLSNATDISGLFQGFNGECNECLNTLNAEKIQAASYAFACNAFRKIPNMIMPNCTNISNMFNSASIEEIGTLDISSVTNATDAFKAYALMKISFVEESIPITVSFANCGILDVESAKSIILGLKNYSGTENEFAYTVSFYKDTRTLLENEGATAPNGMTWIEFAQSKGWNI